MQFKLEVVQRYLAGTIGFKALGHLYGLDYAMAKRWVHLYQAHGEAGLVKKFTAYSAEQKLEILQHMWFASKIDPRLAHNPTHQNE